MQGDNMLDDIDYDTLDGGIRNTVRWLRSHGFDTTDSGDGSKYPEMECAVPFPMVSIQIDVYRSLIPEADRLRGLLAIEGVTVKDGDIQATYDPVSGLAMIVLSNVMIEPTQFTTETTV